MSVFHLISSDNQLSNANYNPQVSQGALVVLTEHSTRMKTISWKDK